MSTLTLSVIVPFHRNLVQLEACLRAIRTSVPGAQLIVVADGARDDCRALATGLGAAVLTVPGPRGPAVARNVGVAQASGDVVAFVDTDVVVAPDALPGMLRVLEDDARVTGVFGAYDLRPAASNFMSQFKNLSHAYVHEIARPDAKTFWAGLGVIRTAAFRAVGGYDERFVRPSVEDIDLGYRLVSAEYQLRLDTRFRGCHLKRWTLWNCIVTDIEARGVPWTQLLHRYTAMTNDLNTSVALRLSVVAAYLLAGCLVAGLVFPRVAIAAVVPLAALVALNWDYYRWMARQRGLGFAAGVVGVHLIHHLCNGVSFVVGTLLYHAAQHGISTRWTLPDDLWTADQGSAASVSVSRS